jgi:hypothetical protein
VPLVNETAAWMRCGIARQSAGESNSQCTAAMQRQTGVLSERGPRMHSLWAWWSLQC